MSSCPYSDELLDYWDGIANPIGTPCCDCDELECEHNLNGQYDDDNACQVGHHVP